MISDLSNFKTKGDVAYDKLDPQIENGVDYFPNHDAPGFTPKTDLESLYKKANSAVPANASGFVPASDGQLSQTWGSTFPTQFKNGFFPIANAVSNYNPPTNESLTFNMGDFSFNNVPKVPSADGSDFMTTPLANFVSMFKVPYNSQIFDVQQHISSGPTQFNIEPFDNTPSVPNAHGGDFMTTPIASYNSRFSLSTPLGAGTKTLKVRKEAFRKVEGESPFDKFVKPFSVETTKNIYGDSDYIKDLFEFRKDGRDTFKNVPNGVDGNGLFSTADFRKVANKGPFDGNNTHPIILRKPGSNWDNYLNEKGIISEGGFFEGALDLIGLLTRTSRDLADKQRIGTYLLSEPGKLFLAKQVAFQALNPTIESKLYNPLSAVGIAGLSDLLQGDISGLLRAAGSFLFPTHVERHVGGLRYEKIILGPGGSRLSNQSKAFRSDIPEINVPSSNTGIGLFDNYVNRQVNNLVSTIDAAAITPIFGLSNPNKYAFPISSAPKSVVDGRPSFIGSADLALEDVRSALEKPGGNFNDASSDNSGRATNGTGDRTKFHTSTYSELRRENRYEKDIKTPAVNQNTHMQNTQTRREEYRKINDNIGNPGGNTFSKTNGQFIVNDILGGGVKRGQGPSTISSAVDKVNIIPYGSDGNGDIPTDHQSTKDFIKFRFFDVVNKKFIIFRAILEGITDTITPEYSEERYIGRPDKLFTYQGVDRSLSFTFSIYPKTKQELPVLMEKLNYLIGLCYPSFTTGDRMVTPFIDLTLGDMFVSTPGILSSLTVTVEEQSTWEITDNLQFPHFIKAACEFRHIGKHVPVSTGRHYDLPFGLDEARQKQIDRFTSDKAFGFNQYPSRKEDFRKEIFGSLGQPNE